jgi:two-component system, LytTR family, response regulator
MKNLRAIILEDEPQCRETLEILLQRHCPEVTVAGVASTIEAGELLWKQEKPCLVFLDVEMPGGNAFSLLKKVEHKQTQIVFTTAHEKYAIQAIKSSALDFLLKPINKDDLIAAVNKAKESIQPEGKVKNLLHNINFPNDNHRIAVASSKEIEFVNISEICYCKAKANHSEVFLKDGRMIASSKPLKDYEDILGHYNFFRIHHSILVNLKLVKKYLKGDGGFAEMADGTQIEVSTRRKAEFLNHLKETVEG